MNLAIVSEVYNEMVSLRVRAVVLTDSRRLDRAIRCIATRRHVAFKEIVARTLRRMGV